MQTFRKEHRQVLLYILREQRYLFEHAENEYVQEWYRGKAHGAVYMAVQIGCINLAESSLTSHYIMGWGNVKEQQSRKDLFRAKVDGLLG